MHACLPFRTRRDAGTQLSGQLTSYKGAENTLILALVRGGVVIGAVLSEELQLALYPYIVRKLGHPSHREYALGAIAEGGATYLDEVAMQMSAITWGDMEPIIEEEMTELKRRKETYNVRPRPDIKDATVILTDDGAATGATLFAAIEDLRNAQAKRIVVALPVCPPDTALKLNQRTDETVVLATPENFSAVGQFYLEFKQVTDEEVADLLKQ